MKKIIITLIIIVAIATAIFIAYQNTRNDANTSELTTIQLNEVTRSVFYAPQYVAISNGFFEEEGLEIEMTTGQGADKVMTAVLAGQSDIGFCGPEAAIYVYNEGKEDYIEVFAQMTQKDGSFLVSKEPTNNFSWKDLVGKTVIPGRKGGVPYMTLEYVLKQNGINPQTDLVLDDSIKFDLMAGAFTGGEAEYVTLFEPTASMTENAGKGYIVAAVGEAAGEVPYTAYCAKKSYIENNSDIIEGFTRAIYKGEQWVKENSAEEIAKTILPQFPDISLTDLTTIVDNYKKYDSWLETPYISEESYKNLQDVMLDAELIKEYVPYEKLINNFYNE